MTTPKEARTERLRARAAKIQADIERDEIHATLGDALAAALLRYLAGAPPERGAALKRTLALADYSDELKRLLVRAIEVNPAMEETFLKIAELAFIDGEEHEHEERFYDQYEM